jgi:hypothetical protein
MFNRLLFLSQLVFQDIHLIDQTTLCVGWLMIDDPRGLVRMI